MTSAEFLADLTGRGVGLSSIDGRLRVEAPAGSLTPADRLALAQQKAELLALLPRPADAELARVRGLIDLQASKCPGLTSVQKRILTDYRTVAEKCHGNRDPLLFDLAGDVPHQIRVIWGLNPARDGDQPR